MSSAEPIGPAGGPARAILVGVDFGAADMVGVSFEGSTLVRCKLVAGETDICGKGLYCDADLGGNGTCRPVVKPGQACSNVLACGPGSSCENKSCGAGKVLGQACSTSYECESLLCEQKTCTRGKPLAKAESCKLVSLA